jgi:hypothetical protein
MPQSERAQASEMRQCHNIYYRLSAQLAVTPPSPILGLPLETANDLKGSLLAWYQRMKCWKINSINQRAAWNSTAPSS